MGNQLFKTYLVHCVFCSSSLTESSKSRPVPVKGRDMLAGHAGLPIAPLCQLWIQAVSGADSGNLTNGNDHGNRHVR